MSPIKVLVLGGQGMLGSMMVRVLSELGYDVSATYSNKINTDFKGADKVKWSFFGLDFRRSPAELDFLPNGPVDYIINCIGVIKPFIDDSDSFSMVRATQINGVFPHVLAQLAQRMEVPVLQIATDCVYSGKNGPYNEGDAHDATDVYGKTKSLGEVQSDWVRNLRCSIIGPEIAGRKRSLFENIRQHPHKTISGYANHRWNGLTTHAFAHMCHSIIYNDYFRSMPAVTHLIPKDVISKYELLNLFIDRVGNKDLQVLKQNHFAELNRELSTNYYWNSKLWEDTPWSGKPTIETMIKGMPLCA